jgi:hypothetical protein
VALWGILLGPLYAAPGFIRTHGWMGLIFGVALAGSLGPRAIRARSLTLTDEGLKHAKGYTYRLTASWDDVVGVQRRGIGFLKFEELRLRAPAPDQAVSPGPSRAPKQISDRYILLGLYDRHWRTGPVGTALRAHGIPLDSPEVNSPISARPN